MATYVVTATGTSPHYQWAKNGVAITGATSSSYVTPPAQFSDTDATFTVTISNSAGTVTSRAAALTVTARAPAPGDLRFQQVDAPTTINGYFNAGPGLSTFLIRGAQYFGGWVGTPLAMGPGNCDVPPSTDGVGCAWPFAVAPLPASLAGASGFIVGYASDLYDNFSGDMSNPNFLGFTNNITPISSSSVITSLDLEPANILFGLSWVQSDQQSGFNLSVQTVAPADLQAAATQEGTNGRVITAVSNNSGQLTYTSYGWQADPGTVYEAQVATASPADAPAAAATLASLGYIITAVGVADSNEDIVLVGTRVQGDTMARPFMTAQQAADLTAMQEQGYAMVGVIIQPVTYATVYLGER